MAASSSQSRRILGTRVDSTSYAEATQQILDWAREARSHYVCLGTVNHIMVARGSDEFSEVMERATLVTSDGMPLVWLLRILGIREATRVYGPDLTPLLLEAASTAGIAVGFYGGTDGSLNRLVDVCRQRLPELRIAYAQAPPFRELTKVEDAQVVEDIRQAGVRILFVGLGTPKQDRWMHAHSGRIRAVMVGVGAAFDFLTGAKPQAPRWMQRNGLEWLFRLASEPRRLWRRYLLQNPQFAALALMQVIRTRFDEHRRTT